MRIARPITHTVVRPLTDPLVGSASFTPGQLFKSGEQGAWYDPSDLSTLFQDSAGTTPVTAVEQPVGKILDKSGRGNHASQTTAASRPVLSARKNLLTYSEQFDNAAWEDSYVAITPNASVAPDGTTTADFIVPSVSNAEHYVGKTDSAYSAGTDNVLSVYVKEAGYRYVFFYVARSGDPIINSIFDFQTGTFVYTGTESTGHTVLGIGNGWYRLSLKAGATSTGFLIQPSPYSSGSNLQAYPGDGVSGLYVWGAQVEKGTAATTYQRITTATDYDTVGFPYYLAFDGVDDYLRTVFPNLGSNVTIGRSIPGTGASILTGQTIGAGNWDDSTSHCALVIINRALTGPETTLLTKYLNTRAGL